MLHSMHRTAAVLGAALLFTTPPAWSSSFSYSLVNARAGQVVLDDRIRLGGDRYEDFNQLAVEGSYQVLEFMAVGLEKFSVFDDQANSEISRDSLEGYLTLPLPVVKGLDLLPRLGYRKTEVKQCAGGSCARDDNEGLTYSGGIRFWLEPDKLELTASYLDADLKGFDSESSLGLGVWVSERNSVGLDYTDQADRSTFEIFWQYNW